MIERPPKPRKCDFSDPREFMRVSAAWANEWNVWPWGGPEDEDDNYCFVAQTPNTETVASFSDPGQIYDGSTEEIFNEIIGEGDAAT